MFDDDDEFYAELDRRMERAQTKAPSKTSRSKPENILGTAFGKNIPQDAKAPAQSRLPEKPDASEVTGLGDPELEPGPVTKGSSASVGPTPIVDENMDASINFLLNYPVAPKAVKHASDPLPRPRKRKTSDDSAPEVTACTSNSAIALSPRIGESFLSKIANSEGQAKKRRVDPSPAPRYSSPIEDISMFSDEPPEPPKPKKEPVPKSRPANSSRSIQRQPVTHKLIPGKPVASHKTWAQDELEDISMFSADDSPPTRRPELSARSDTSVVTTPGGPSTVVAVQKRVKPVASMPSIKPLGRPMGLTRGATGKPKTSVKDYVRSVQGRPCGPSNFLKGKVIYYIGADGSYISDKTKNRVDILIKHGAMVQSDFDPTTATQIIVDVDVIAATVVRVLGIGNLMDIPDHIPTLTWSWISSAINNPQIKKLASNKNKEANFDDLLPKYYEHVRFKERFEAGDDFYAKRERPKGKGKVQPRASTSRVMDPLASGDEDSRDIDPSDIPTPVDKGPLPSPPVSPGPSKSKKVEEPADPLAEFYAQAQADIEKGFDTDSDKEGEQTQQLPKKKRYTPKGWQCDIQPGLITQCPNQYIIDKLENLMKIHDAKPGAIDFFRVKTYRTIIPRIREFTKPITKPEDLEGINGIGKGTISKVMEIAKTGSLRKLKYEDTEEVRCIMAYQGVYGVGPNVARDWYRAGCRTLDDVRARKGGISLSTAQEVGLKFYNDINTRIPRAEAEEIFDSIKAIARKIDPKISIEIMGSFRRGKSDCGDIDVLITRPTDDGKTHAGIMKTLLRTLHSAGIITEDVHLPDDMNDLECVYRGLCRLPDDEDSLRRRIDILSVPWQSRGAALLYYTGDDIFNRSMRLKAKKMGYSLNQRGLYSGVVWDPNNRKTKLNEGTIIASETEERIFEILGVPWQEPRQRARRLS